MKNLQPLKNINFQFLKKDYQVWLPKYPTLQKNNFFVSGF